jgi:hypothetical protein
MNKIAPAGVVHAANKRLARKNANPPFSKIGFVSASQIATGGETLFSNPALAGDFNGDGKKDVVTIVGNSSGGSTTYSISVVLSNGDGTFQTPVLTATPSNLDDPFIVGDVNGDGKDDIIVAHNPGGTGSANFDVLLSNGDGTFKAPVNSSVTTNFLAGGILFDVNGDGKLDVVIVDSATPGNVWTLLGNGDGTFQAPTSVALSGEAGSNVAFGDFNGDGLLDFADNDYNSGELTVYLAVSPTQYAAGAMSPTSDGVYDACGNAVGDLNNDGMPEIVSVNCINNDNTITIYVNNGDGTFQQGVYSAVATAPSTSSVPYIAPYAVTIADVNGDGNADIISTNYFAGDITVLLGNGDGTVQVPTFGYATGGAPSTAAVVADFNGDGLPDILVADNVYSFSYMKGYGDGTFRAASDFYAPTTDNGEPYAFEVATGDLNGDGYPDVVIGSLCCDSTVGITVFLSRGDGSLQPGVNYGSGGYLGFIAIADFNKDGILDIAAVDNISGMVQIFTGNGSGGIGNGTFTAGSAYATGDADSEKIVAIDLNGDGFPDLIVANNGGSNFGVFMNDGTGNFDAEVPYTIFSASKDIAVADVNGDGKLDLLAPEWACGCVAVFLGNGDGTFATEQDFFVANNPFLIAIGDLNNDGKPDIAVTSWDYTNGMGIAVALGNGDGTFQAANSPNYPSSLQSATLNPYPTYISLADLDGDGNLDLVYNNSEYGTVGVMYGIGNGTFYDPVEYPTAAYSEGLALADVNGDGAVDVITASNGAALATVLLNNSGTKALADYSVVPNPATATVTAGQTGTYLITLTPRNFYNGTVTFSCGTLPSKTTCVFSNPTLTPNGNAAMTSTLTLTTTATTSAAMVPGVNPHRGAMTLVASLTGMGFFGLMLSGDWKKKANRRMGILLAIVAMGMLIALVGCGGGSSTTTTITPPPPVPGTPSGTYQVTVTATGTAGTTNGNTSAHTLTLTLTVQ